MKLTIVLYGGLTSCCTIYPAGFVRATVKRWLAGICAVEVIDAKHDNYAVDDLASLAVKYFGQKAYPFIYIDDVLICFGYFPDRQDLISTPSQKSREGITYQDIAKAAKRYGIDGEIIFTGIKADEILWEGPDIRLMR